MVKTRTAPSPGDHVKDADEREGKEKEHAKVVEHLLPKRNNCCITSEILPGVFTKTSMLKPQSIRCAKVPMWPEAYVHQANIAIAKQKGSINDA